MYLHDAFDDFVRRISLDDTRLRRVRSAHNSVRKQLRSIDEVRSRMTGTYLQGSYALHTPVRPLDEDTGFDVDVVLAADFTDDVGDRWNANAALGWLQEHVESVPLYEGKTHLKRCCVCIDYAGDLHLDIVPAHRPDSTDGPIYVPCRGLVFGNWKPSDPKGYLAWFEAKKRESDHLLHLVLLAKYWRNIQADSPNSMVLTTLVAQHAPDDAASLGEALSITFRSIAEQMDRESGLFMPFRVPNPTMEDENLAADWDYFDQEAFCDALVRATDQADEALASTDEADTINLWNHSDLFDGRFPKEIRGVAREASAVAGRLSSGAAAVDAGGRISVGEDTSGQGSPSNGGFFGD